MTEIKTSVIEDAYMKRIWREGAHLGSCLR